MANEIQWADGAVCYANGQQWVIYDKCGLAKFSECAEEIIACKDFQLNEIREGDFIPASYLDTEQKYNEVVEVFMLFDFKFGSCAAKGKPSEESGFYLSILDNEIWNASGSGLKRQLTYHQIIAIGKLKRMMLERENIERQSSYCRCKQVALSVDDKPNNPEISDSLKHDKSKQAYDILKSLDYEYDLVKHKWFKKQYID